MSDQHTPHRNLRHHPARRHAGRRLQPLAAGQADDRPEARRAWRGLHRRRIPAVQPEGRRRSSAKCAQLKLKHAKVSRLRHDPPARHEGRGRSGHEGAARRRRRPVVTFVGKTSDYQVEKVMSVTLEENLEMIARLGAADAHAAGRQVVYDAEHFFDTFQANREYALQTLLRGAGSRRVGAVPVRHQRRHRCRSSSPRPSPR